ncbi:hypothetical protein JXQ70_02985 [bacterium]|nr:hypothetical protein [bacterium]
MRNIRIYMISCVIASLIPLIDYDRVQQINSFDFPGWPKMMENCELQEIPRTRLETRFEKDFPGYIGHFRMCEKQLSIRWIRSSSRKIHPVSHCYKGSGYSIKPLPLWLDDTGEKWGCFHAVKGSEVTLVKERIFDEQGHSWSDVSSWYWASLLGTTTGPWWAITIASKCID